jgi:2-polyprenyl-3-methyl-5-hydroxy-6-metoxy-1,4-benzoquinol methylase
MNKPDTSIIDQEWPAEELEDVHECPYCYSKERTLAYKDVQDWSFYCAPGKWTYWSCKNCETLYLNPRPKEEFIYKAYGSYYTHGNEGRSFMKKVKEKLRNECYSHWLNASIEPRLGIPKWWAFLLKIFKARIQIPFDLEQLVALPKGRLLDVGCGNGETLLLARQLGWDVTGLEIDPKAAEYAKKLGLNVIEGGHEKLKNMSDHFDCVICSHVLEHVHDPKYLIKNLLNIMKNESTLILGCPNSKSSVLKEYGSFWRGLEAPRHITIPSARQLKLLLGNEGFKKTIQKKVDLSTVLASEEIRNVVTASSNNKKIKIISNNNINESDFINLISIK